MFGTGKKNDIRRHSEVSLTRTPAPDLLIVASELVIRDRERLSAEALQLPTGQLCEAMLPNDPRLATVNSPYVLSLFNNPLDIDFLADKVIAARNAGGNSVLIVAINPSQLVALGQWLERRAAAGKLSGTRLMMAPAVDGVARQVAQRM